MWNYNPKLGRWYHSTGATSDNGPNDPPEEPAQPERNENAVETSVNMQPRANSATNAQPMGCAPCGNGQRQVR